MHQQTPDILQRSLVLPTSQGLLTGLYMIHINVILIVLFVIKLFLVLIGWRCFRSEQSPVFTLVGSVVHPGVVIAGAGLRCGEDVLQTSRGVLQPPDLCIPS